MPQNRLVKQSYSDIAAEYYDRKLHPTSANFRTASKYFIKTIIEHIVHPQLCTFLEVGAGQAVSAEIFQEINLPLSNLIITDLHQSMLAYSDHLVADGAKLEISDAQKIYHRFDNLDYIISSLGDPYNTTDFWTSTYKALKIGGHCIFTTPSLEWSVRFREISQSGDMHHAHFILQDGTKVNGPSLINSVEEQIDVVAKAGFSVIQYDQIFLKDIPGSISPKLVSDNGDDLPVITGYVFKKTN